MCKMPKNELHELGSPLLLATEQVVRSLSLEVISKTF